MITGTKEELDQYVQTHRCPEHDNPLVVAWHAGENNYVIRCGAGHFPAELVPVRSRTAQYKQGELEAVDKTFNLLPTKDLETGQLLSIQETNALIAYASRYGLDAYRGHVMLMYGKPYIGIDGYLYHARQQNIPYKLVSRPLNDEERKTMQLEEGDHGWKAECELLQPPGYFVGIGIVTKEELTEKSKKKPDQLRYPVVAAHPWQLAQKRAEWQALRRAFPIGETEGGKEE